jgi:hypothetical protein
VLHPDILEQSTLFKDTVAAATTDVTLSTSNVLKASDNCELTTLDNTDEDKGLTVAV